MPNYHYTARDERGNAVNGTLTAPTPEALWHVAREHGIGFIIPSPKWTPIAMQRKGEKDDALGVYFQDVHDGPGAVPIYKIVGDAS